MSNQILPVNMKPLTLWEKINLYFKPLLVAEDKELIVSYKVWRGTKFIFDIRRKVIVPTQGYCKDNNCKGH